MATITHLSASGWNGSYTHGDISGSFSTDGSRTLININGVSESLGSFDAYWTGSALSYNLHPKSLDEAGQLSELVSVAVAEVIAALTESDSEEDTTTATE